MILSWWLLVKKDHSMEQRFLRTPTARRPGRTRPGCQTVGPLKLWESAGFNVFLILLCLWAMYRFHLPVVFKWYQEKGGRCGWNQLTLYDRLRASMGRSLASHAGWGVTGQCLLAAGWRVLCNTGGMVQEIPCHAHLRPPALGFFCRTF